MDFALKGRQRWQALLTEWNARQIGKEQAKVDDVLGKMIAKRSPKVKRRIY